MKDHDSVCAGCSTGCSIRVDENQDKVYRLKPRENPHVNHWWMCDDGRYGFKHVHDKGRVTSPRVRVDGEPTNIEWSAVPDKLTESLKKAGHLAAVISPHLTVEEAYLLARYVKEIDEDAILALGPVPVEARTKRFQMALRFEPKSVPIVVASRPSFREWAMAS